MTSRLLAYMVSKDEQHRYLDACLAWSTQFLDAVSLYDDCSTDDTADLAASHGAYVQVRPESVPSFLDHEGAFRQRAWRWFEEALEPEPNDIVLALDADEFLVAEPDGVRATVELAMARADAAGSLAVMLPVPEVFDAEHAIRAATPADLDAAGPLDLAPYTLPRVRTDGFWGTIAGTRLFRYERGGTFRNKEMGSGAEPTYVVNSAPRAPRQPGLSLLHLGYMDWRDRAAKHKRYTELLDHGHSNSHVQSIITPPTLEPWTGPWPEVWRGVRREESTDAP